MRFNIDKKRLPPLDALVAFEAAARLGSFALAGTEIHLTPSAISRQVKALEEHLQVKLFERVRQRISLTEAGRFLAIQIRQTLGHLLTVSDQAAHLRSSWKTLNVGVLPAFATYWLIPRLSGFLQKHSDILLNLISISADMNYETAGLDAAIVTNANVWSDSEAYKLGEECLVAVASPEWVKNHAPSEPKDLLHHTLLTPPQRAHAWNQWFESNNVQITVFPKHLQFGHYSMVVAAALSSLGVALVPQMLCTSLIESGRLLEIPGKSISVGAGYFLCHPLHRESYEPMNLFRDWLLSTIAKEEGASPAQD